MSQWKSNEEMKVKKKKIGKGLGDEATKEFEKESIIISCLFQMSL